MDTSGDVDGRGCKLVMVISQLDYCCSVWARKVIVVKSREKG